MSTKSINIIENNIKERNVMIVPVGLEKDRIIEGCIVYPINILYLLNNPKLIPNKNKEKIPAVYKYSLEFSKKIVDYFRETPILKFSEEVALNSFSDCLTILNKIFNKENKYENLNHIYINVSTASKSFGLAAFFFASFHRELTTLFYLKTSNYIILDYLQKASNKESTMEDLKLEFTERGLTKGPYEIEEIPLFPIIEFTQTQKLLIKVLSLKNEFDSINDLINYLPEELKSENRVQLRRLLATLEQKNLIKVIKKGREKKIIVLSYLRYIAEGI